MMTWWQLPCIDKSNENADNTRKKPIWWCTGGGPCVPSSWQRCWWWGVQGVHQQELHLPPRLPGTGSQWCVWYSWLITIMTLQVVDAAVRNAKASPTIEKVGGKLILTLTIRTLISKSNALKSTSSDNSCKRALRLIIVNIFSRWEKRRRRMWRRRAILTLREKLWSCDYHQNTTH